MDLLESLLNFVSNYGWPGVCSVIIFGCLLFAAKYYNNKADDRSDKLSNKIVDAFYNIEEKRMTHDKEVEIKLIDTITTTINTAINSNNIKEKQSHKELEGHRKSITGDVSDKLLEMMHKFNAQRAIIMELHNGGVNLNGLSFIRYDITNEKQEKGILPINGHVQNLPASNLEIVCRDILESPNDVVIYNETEIDQLYDRGATVLYSNLTENLPVNHIIFCGIYNEENILYAIIALEYHIEYPYPENVIDEIELARYTSEITQLYKYVKKY